MTHRQTILLIHGTFAKQDVDAPPKWYEPGSEFVSRLDAALEERKCGARCWAHLQPGDDRRSMIFSWSGENTWQARSEASSRLTHIINNLIKDGWRCHVIAHSHGGNVLMDSIPKLPQGRGGNISGWERAWGKGGVVFRGNGAYITLSTPFMDTWTGSPEHVEPAQHGRWKDFCISLAIIIGLGIFWTPLYDVLSALISLI